MLEIAILRRRAKKGITFPSQSPQWVELFGVRCLAIGFLRGYERRVLFIANTHTEGFHNGHKIFRFIPSLQNRCYELPFTGQVDLGTEQFTKGFYI